METSEIVIELPEGDGRGLLFKHVSLNRCFDGELESAGCGAWCFSLQCCLSHYHGGALTEVPRRLQRVRPARHSVWLVSHWNSRTPRHHGGYSGEVVTGGNSEPTNKSQAKQKPAALTGAASCLMTLYL